MDIVNDSDYANLHFSSKVNKYEPTKVKFLRAGGAAQW
jgi:hypothetical protein